MSSLRAPEHVPASDGNDGLRQAKRRKPTDRALPSFQPSRAQASTVGPTATRLAPSTAALQRLTTSYSRLQDVERKLDWNVARKTAELAESLVGTRIPGIQRTLRIHLTSRPVGQPWQVPLADVAAPTLPNEVKDEPATEGDEAKATVPVDFATNDGVPRFELDITGELLQATDSGLEGTPGNFTRFIRRVVVETDRDPALYGGPTTIDWRRPPASMPQGAPGLTLSFASSVPTSMRVSFYLDHQPERMALQPEVAALLDMYEADRASLTTALWGYIKLNDLQDEDKRHVKCDARMSKMFAGQDKVPFHHIPEYINRFLIPSPPVAIDTTIRVDEGYAADSHRAYDVSIMVNDPVKAHVVQALQTLTTPSEATKEIVSIDEKIALSCTQTRAASIKRSFLTSFACAPIPFISQFVSSQSSDLEKILSGSRASEANLGGGAKWQEEIRRAEVWEGDWVKEGISVFESRRDEGIMKDKIRARQVQVPLQQQQMQMPQQLQQQYAQQYAMQQQQQQQYARR